MGVENGWNFLLRSNCLGSLVNFEQQALKMRRSLIESAQAHQ